MTNNLSDFQLSFYANTTRIGLDKLRFSKEALPWIKGAIDDLFKQIDQYNKAGVPAGESITTKIPYTIFPSVARALKTFNKKHESDFLILYYKHSALGIIKEDLPRTYPICPKCGGKTTKQIKKEKSGLFKKTEIQYDFCPKCGEVQAEMFTI